MPVGPGSDLDYTITVRNIGNAAATDVRITDPLPGAHQTFVSAGQGGGHFAGKVRSSGTTRPCRPVAASTRHLHACGSGRTCRVGAARSSTTASSSRRVGQHVSTTGSPHDTAIAPPNGVSDLAGLGHRGGKDGQVGHVRRARHQRGLPARDCYDVSTSGGSWTPTVYDATCTTPMTTTPSVARRRHHRRLREGRRARRTRSSSDATTRR